MDLDLDPFDDVLLEPTVTNARPGGKFQPKAKPKPRNIPAVSVPLEPQSEATETADASLPYKTNKSESLQPNAADTSLDAANDCPARKECMDSMDALHVEVATSGGDYSPSYSKLTKEAESLEIDLDHLDGVPLKENLATNNGSSSVLMELDVASQHPVTCSIHTNDGMLETEFQEPRTFPNLQQTDMISDSIVASDSRARKFQTQFNSQDGDESFAAPTDAQFVHSETMCVNDSSTPAFPSDDVLDCSSINFGDFTASELPTNEEHASIALSCSPQGANIVHLEDACEEPEDENCKNRERKDSFASNQINKGDASSRQLRKRAVAPTLIDEPEDEVGGFAFEPPSNSALSEEDKDYEYREEKEDNDIDNSGQRYSSQKDNKSKRLKKHAPEEGKPVRKRKGSDDASDLPSHKARRKFSHSTRRKKRLQELLALPEHEIEFQRLSCRDIILLAEHREQLASKEAKAAKTSQNSQSTKKSFNEEHFNNEDTQGNSTTEPSFTLFNSHSFMEKTPRIRWTKQDTELFYEGVRQFGTDLSMIQQLFPGRTRHQIKLKLKKEERQQPTRLYEALSNRPKDHSYFEKVIEQLQKVAAEEEDEFVRNGSVNGTGKEEADLYPENNDDAGNSENGNDAAAEDEEVNTVPVRSPVKSDENDYDDLDIWSSYRSDF